MPLVSKAKVQLSETSLQIFRLSLRDLSDLGVFLETRSLDGRGN
jgi:hypothetical protein